MINGKQINPIILNSLIDARFIERFRDLFEKYNNDDGKYKWSDEVVVEELNAIGLQFKYNNQRKFYLDESLRDWKFSFGFSAKYNLVEFGFNLVNPDLGISLATAWANLYKTLAISERVILPGFSNKEEHYSIVKTGFDLFNDVKNSLLGQLV